jgi:hypothetical protein
VIAWRSNIQTGTYEIYAQRYNSSGVAQGSNFLVSTLTTSGNQIDPKVAMNAAEPENPHGGVSAFLYLAA